MTVDPMAKLEAAAIKYPAGCDRADFISPVMSDFLDWLIDPQKEGNQTDWAKAHGVAPASLAKWKKEKFFREEWDQRSTKLFGGPDKVQTLMESLFEEAKGGDVKAIALYLQIIEKHTPKKIIQTEGSADSMSDEDLAAALDASARGLRRVK